MIKASIYLILVKTSSTAFIKPVLKSDVTIFKFMNLEPSNANNLLIEFNKYIYPTSFLILMRGNNPGYLF